MTENNEIMELKYTEEQVMRALMQLEPEEKEVLFSSNLNSIKELANNEEFAKTVLDGWIISVNAYLGAIKAVLQFMEILSKQENNTVDVIEAMAECYKDLSREERLEFSKRMAEESNLVNSLDSLKYQWYKVTSKLFGTK